MDMFNPAHPGEVLRELYLQPLGLTVTEFARRIGITRKSASELINGRFGLSLETAMRIGLATNTSAESWLGMQTQYDLWQARQRKLHKQIKVEKLAA
jgi:addiction module HigA family antidote